MDIAVCDVDALPTDVPPPTELAEAHPAMPLIVPYENVADQVCSALSYDVDVAAITGSNTTNTVSFLTHIFAANADIGININKNNQYLFIIYPALPNCTKHCRAKR